MGIGFFNGGDLKLCVSFRYHATDGEIAAWKLCFEYVSEMLFYATGGQVRIDEIVWVNDEGASDVADAFITKSAYQSHVEQLGGFGQASMPMYLGANAMVSPFEVLHELGHHVFSLGDEYRSTDAKARCTNDQTVHQGCIMSDGGTRGGKPAAAHIDDKGQLIEGYLKTFCNANNHVINTTTSHHSAHGNKSCAEVIKDEHGIDVTPWDDTIVPVSIANEPLTWTPADSSWAVVAVLEESDSTVAAQWPFTLGLVGW